jgi:hypothetical protein
MVMLGFASLMDRSVDINATGHAAVYGIAFGRPAMVETAS